MFPFMKEYVSVHHPIIYNGLKYLTPMFLSIKIMVHFSFNAWIEFKEQNQLDEKLIDSLIQRSRFLDIRKAKLIILST